MLKFICLGSGSSGNCYALWTERATILVDAGLGIRTLKRSLNDAGLSINDIDAVLITHDHADHIKAVGYLAKDYAVPIYTTCPVHDGINSNYCIGIKVSPDCRRDILKGQPYTIGDITFTAFDVPHDSHDCMGFRIEHQAVSFVLLTDVGSVTAVIEKEVECADYLVVEANHEVEMLRIGPYPAYLKGRILSDRGHMSNNTCARLIAEHATPRLKHVWLCHLSEENNHPELARKTIDSTLRSYGLSPGTDFQLEVLRRRVPSAIFQLV